MANYQEHQSVSNDFDETSQSGHETSSHEGMLADKSHHLKNCIDLDEAMDVGRNMEDLNELDGLLSKLQSDMEQKLESKNKVEKKNTETKTLLKSSKYLNAEFQQLQGEEEKAGKDLRDMIEARRIELEHLHSQQVDDLVQFENGVYLISQQFMNGPRTYESNGLMERVFQLKADLEEKIKEFSQYKEDLQITEGKLKQGQKTDEKLQVVPLKVFEESIEDINTLNDKLTKSVEQISIRVKSMKFEMGCFGFQK